MFGGLGAERFRPELEQYLGRYNFNLIRYMEVHEPSILPSEHVHVETGLLLREFIQPEVRYKSVKILSGVQGSAG